MRKKGICIKTYLTPEAFAEIAMLAEEAGERRRGLLLYTQKKNGLEEQKLANTDGISGYLKFCSSFYKNNKAEANRKLAELEAEADRIEKEKAKLKGY